MNAPSPNRWLVSQPFDLTFFIGPAVLGLLAVVPSALGFGPEETPTWAWLAVVVCVDVAHVWASLYRVYLDPVELARRPMLYWGTPVAVFAVAAIVHWTSPGGFWTLLAYLAVYHFIKQQVGFVALYRHRGGQTAPWERRLDHLAVYTGTLVPVLWWHAHLPRAFSWFMPGDFLTLVPAGIAPFLWLPYGLVGAVWGGHRLVAIAGRGAINPGRDLTMVLTWATWYVGIVALNMDFTFTITNILLHGVPYMALVWATTRTRGDKEAAPSPQGQLLRWITRPSNVWAFVGLLLIIACVEEGLWDITVWQDHPQIFGDWSQVLPDAPWVAGLFVPLLTVPQATHYVLDGFIWRMDGSNPGLRQRLLGAPSRP